MKKPTLPLPLHTQGFSLIELMVALAISAIIGAVALPAYQNYALQGKIPSALSILSTKQLQLEQFFLDNRTYVGGPACTADTTSSSYFNFACPTLTAATYQITATGKSTMTGFTYTIDQNNVKATTTVPSGWTGATNCWITKKGGVC